MKHQLRGRERRLRQFLDEWIETLLSSLHADSGGGQPQHTGKPLERRHQALARLVTPGTQSASVLQPLLQLFEVATKEERLPRESHIDEIAGELPKSRHLSGGGVLHRRNPEPRRQRADRFPQCTACPLKITACINQRCLPRHRPVARMNSLERSPDRQCLVDRGQVCDGRLEILVTSEVVIRRGRERERRGDLIATVHAKPHGAMDGPAVCVPRVSGCDIGIQFITADTEPLADIIPLPVVRSLLPVPGGLELIEESPSFGLVRVELHATLRQTVLAQSAMDDVERGSLLGHEQHCLPD